ncbi:MAG: BBP7 family outer membrane beta-barrel protein [Planctomycetales bacterium]|nr:BBP7 family outer membrane beta-barrel protein [Planctomycetales bacterium]
MRTHLMRHFAVAVGFTVGTVTAANGFAAERWNNFQRPAAPIRSTVGKTGKMPFGATVQSVAMQNGIEDLPAPQGELLPPQQPQPDHAATASRMPAYPAPVHQPAPSMSSPIVADAPMSGDCQSCGPQGYQSPYAAAVAAPCQDGTCGGTCTAAPSPKPISPYFGGAGLLFWSAAGGNDSTLVTYDNGVVVSRNSDLDPGNAVGFDIHAGRYFGCGQYGLDLGYMFWNPGTYSRVFTDGGAGLRLINPATTTVSINRGGGATTIYDEFDTNATAIRVTRDMRIQGFEANLIGFGLMGARRLGSCSPAPIFGGSHNVLGGHGSGYYGGAIGPLARASSGRLRVQTLHGFRWFQLEDELEIAANVDGVGGYQPADLYYMSETENNLFGYQFGSMLSYCLGSRAMVNVGGKIGVYGNDAKFMHRITTDTAMGYTNSQGAGAGDICTESSDVSLAGLGELDMGLGYRLSNRWTVNGGYRVLAACGVATAVGQMPTEYSTAASAGAVRADDCLILHGAYLGLDYNW